jgi:exodeoxyribonuclease VII small subunit
MCVLAAAVSQVKVIIEKTDKFTLNDTSFASQRAKSLTHGTRRANALVMTEQTNDTDHALNFEEALKALEAIVHRLESGDAPLDESIALYERGNHLRTLCQQRLDAAKARIEAITIGADGTPAGTQPFDAE